MSRVGALGRLLRNGLMLSLLPSSLSAQSRPTADLLSRRLDLMFASVDSLTTPGCVVGVDRPGRPLLYRAYGVSDLERPAPNDTSTVFEAGSVSKQVTAAAVLLLSFEGKLSLDDTLRRWFPEIARSIPPITVRQLLTHQSGLPDLGDLVEMSGWARGTRAYEQREMIALVARQRRLNFVPGAEYSYSNSNYAFAAELVARASGVSFAEYTRRAIFAPLGMTHTSWRDDYTRRVANRATGWTPGDNDEWKLDMPFENSVGHGGMLTTAPDLMRWQQAFVVPRIGGEAFAREMQQPGVLTDGRVTGYALGLEVGIERGRWTVSHGGWTGGYKAYVGRVPSRGVSVALLCNAGSLRTDLLGPTLLALADGDTTAASDGSVPSYGAIVTEGPSAALTGQYRSRRTGQPVDVRVYRDGLTVNRWTGYRRLSDDHYEAETGAREIVAERDSLGELLRLRLITATRDTVVLEPAPAWVPAATELAAYTGLFTSDETGAEWRLSVVRDTLMVTRRVGQQDALIPRYAHAFSAPSQGWLVRFIRDESGRMIGFEVGLPRTRSIRFDRAATR